MLDHEKQERNEQINNQINACLQEQLSQTNLLKDHLLELYLRRNEHFALSRGQAMLQAPAKTLIFEEVRSVLQYMQELNLTNFVAFEKLNELYESQKTWRGKIRDLLLAAPCPSVETLTQEMRSCRTRERGVTLMLTRMQELRRLFAMKPSCDEAINLLGEDLLQTVFDNTAYIERLTQKCLWVTEFDNLPQALQQF